MREFEQGQAFLQIRFRHVARDDNDAAGGVALWVVRQRHGWFKKMLHTVKHERMRDILDEGYTLHPQDMAAAQRDQRIKPGIEHLGRDRVCDGDRRRGDPVICRVMRGGSEIDRLRLGQTQA